MTKLYTTKEVITEEEITQPIALRWAKKHGVTMLGNQYVWKKSEKDLFHKRNKKRGRYPSGREMNEEEVEEFKKEIKRKRKKVIKENV